MLSTKKGIQGAEGQKPRHREGGTAIVYINTRRSPRYSLVSIKIIFYVLILDWIMKSKVDATVHNSVVPLMSCRKALHTSKVFEDNVPLRKRIGLL